MKFGTILWQECVFFKRKFSSITIGSIIGPVLDMIAFGWGAWPGMEVEGMDYMSFVIAGVLAMNTMSSSFSTIANDINISRLYGKTFENFMIAPMNMRDLCSGKDCGGDVQGNLLRSLNPLNIHCFQSGFENYTLLYFIAFAELSRLFSTGLYYRHCDQIPWGYGKI